MIKIKMQPAEVQKLSPRIIVAGIGGAGGNAVNNMIRESLDGCEFLVCNTDAQALQNSLCSNRVQLGAHVTGGLGAGSKPEIGRAAAEESIEDVMQFFEGANMAFITAGMGGGTGTGAAPVIARACRERGILTVGVVTKPFHFEGSHRMKSADRGIDEIQDYVDTLIVIPNQNLFRIANEKTTFAEAFKMADSVLQAGVRGVTDLMVRPGLVNLDFADIRTAMLEMGKAMMGTGEAAGPKRAVEAAEAAINNPLLDDVSMKGARGVIINVTGGYDMTLFEADEACNRIRDEVDPDANIIFGATFDETLEGTMRVSIVATGIDREKEAARRGGGSGQSGRLERAVPNTTASQPESFGAPNAGPSYAASSHSATAQPGSAGGFSAGQKPPAFVTAQSLANGRAPGPSQAYSPTPAQKIIETYAPNSYGAVHAPKAQEPEVDMFEQQEFIDFAAEASAKASGNASMRGTIFNNAFIPPKPVEVAAAPAAAASSSYIASFHGAHVPEHMSSTTEPDSMPGAGLGSSLKLNPPQVNTAQKRSPSLFERITGSVQGRIEEIAQSVRGAADAPRERVAPRPGMVPADQMTRSVLPGQSMPAQGRLNIDAPAKAASPSDENLDIPAFLRRQAN